MDPPSELCLAEIRNFMLQNGCKVTNHALVKHFKRFLTNPDNQNEARKQFKTYVNTLATIKNENNEKFLILRKKYLNECPPEDSVNRSDAPMSPGAQSLISVGEGSPYRQPPPYKPPPEVTSPSSSHVKLPVLESGTKENYRDCISEFQAAVSKIDSNRLFSESSQPSTPEICQGDTGPPVVPPRKRTSIERSVSRETSLEENKENVAALSSVSTSKNEKDSIEKSSASDVENPISVKEATKKFNRMASEEEAKIIISPTSKKKPEKAIPEDKMTAEVTLAHPKSKEWIVSAAKANYQELAKLASDHPELVKLQDPTTGTALHWAAKHGKEDVVKLIAGTYKADVNARTNGGYTPLHLAMQFGKDNIFELLCNTYKANRDLLDWSGNKPLDYRKQRTTVSASTYSKIKARKKHSEKDLGFLRIGSLNVRVKKTTEAFSNFLGVGGGNTNNSSSNHHPPHYPGMTNMNTTPANRLPVHMRTSAPPASKCFDKLHKNWGSADNITHDQQTMPPPKYGTKKTRSKRTSEILSTGSNSMPTTPNQLRAPIGILSDNSTPGKPLDSDSDSACGFDQNWSESRSSVSNSSSSDRQQPPSYI